jgi:iron complex transport system ATP-binding protein
VTADTIRRIFEVETTIRYTDDGVPFLLPQTMRRPAMADGVAGNDNHPG